MVEGKLGKQVIKFGIFSVMLLQQKPGIAQLDHTAQKEAHQPYMIYIAGFQMDAVKIQVFQTFKIPGR